MKIGIAVFSYCRNNHLEQVLNGLKTNQDINKIYIFQDGLKKEEHRRGWQETTKLIEAIDWCEVKYIKAIKNQGLRTSIIQGINYVFEENDAIVVIEDDCVPTSGFFNYMRTCLERYEFDKRVWNISGFARAFLNDGEGSYFSQKMEAWGWGTWKDRWEQCDFDKNYLALLRRDRELSLKANIWYGLGVENIFYAQEQGKSDSWAAWWIMCILEHNGLCLNPYRSYICNIGFDGSGTNCGNAFDKNYVSQIQDKNDLQIVLPQDVCIEENVKMMFALNGTGSPLAYRNLMADIPPQNQAVVYGVGAGLREFEHKISQSYDVVAFVDRERRGFYAGEEIIPLEELTKFIAGNPDIKVLITLLDANIASEIKEGLINEYGVGANQIIVLSQLEKGNNDGLF